jgi:ubiquinone/menaquinone biosynthesis C-methylase UbiE
MNGVYVTGSQRAGARAVGELEPLPSSHQLTEGELVVNIDDSWLGLPNTVSLVERAIALARASGATAVVALNGQGQRLPGFSVAVGSVLPGGPPSQWVPLVIYDDEYDPAAHRVEAEQYRDRIGDRLLRPEAVPPDKQNLIADDRQRAARVLELGYQGRVLDVGTSDGTLLLETVRRWNLSGAVGVDVARSAIEEATAALSRDPALADRVTFLEGFIEELVFPDASFDIVSACETLEHVGPGQFDRALANLLRMLRPGGTMLMTVPNRYPSPAYEQGGRARWAWPAHHQFFTERSVAHLLTPFFERLEFISHYPGEAPGDSIYLICRATGHRA